MNYHEAVLVSAVDKYYEAVSYTALDYTCQILFIISVLMVIASMSFIAGRMYERRG